MKNKVIWYRQKDRRIADTSICMKPGYKGYIHTIEVLLALAMISVTIVLVFSSAQSPVSARTALIKKQAFEALEYMDQNDELRSLAHAGNSKEIGKRVKELLPSGVNAEADVCISSCFGNLPKNKTVVSVNYYVSGYRDTYFTKKIKLWMWGNI